MMLKPGHLKKIISSLVTPQFHSEGDREFGELQHMSKAKLIGDIDTADESSQQKCDMKCMLELTHSLNGYSCLSFQSCSLKKKMSVFAL
jgi:hypothetical protein